MFTTSMLPTKEKKKRKKQRRRKESRDAKGACLQPQGRCKKKKKRGGGDSLFVSNGRRRGRGKEKHLAELQGKPRKSSRHIKKGKGRGRSVGGGGGKKKERKESPDLRCGEVIACPLPCPVREKSSY